MSGLLTRSSGLNLRTVSCSQDPFLFHVQVFYSCFNLFTDFFGTNGSRAFISCYFNGAWCLSMRCKPVKSRKLLQCEGNASASKVRKAPQGQLKASESNSIAQQEQTNADINGIHNTEHDTEATTLLVKQTFRHESFVLRASDETITISHLRFYQYHYINIYELNQDALRHIRTRLTFLCVFCFPIFSDIFWLCLLLSPCSSPFFLHFSCWEQVFFFGLKGA